MRSNQSVTSLKDVDFFKELVGQPFVLTIIVPIYTIATVILITLLTGIIWYEKFFDSRWRSLGNRIVSWICIYSLWRTLISYIVWMIRYVTVIPMAPFICYYISIVENALMIQVCHLNSVFI